MFVQIFGKVAELNWMWKTALEEFSNQVCKVDELISSCCFTTHLKNHLNANHKNNLMT